MKELIKHAAVKSKEGVIFIGKRHADCFEKGHKKGVPMSNKAEDEGFLTSNGRFVKRHEAFEIALESKQILPPENTNLKILFSEDLWCPTYNGTHQYDETKGYY